MCSYYDKEWKIVEDIFNDMAGGDTPMWVLERAFDTICDEYDAYPQLPPSVIMKTVTDRLWSYKERARSETTMNMFLYMADVTESALIWYLSDIFLIDPSELSDFAYEQIAVPQYYTKKEYEEIRKGYME